MITVMEIINLCKDKQLKSCRFMPGDPSKNPIGVDENSIPYLIQERARKNLSDIPPEELEIMEVSDDYYCNFTWNEAMTARVAQQKDIQRKLAENVKISHERTDN